MQKTYCMKRFFIPLFLWCVSVSSLAQQDSVIARFEGFLNDIRKFNTAHPQEKVYLHFDNTGYFLGETIWFKAYITLASTHVQTPLSKVLYVELLNEEGYILESRKCLIENGQASGEFSLKKLGMRSGFYEVRAYTRTMLNWDKDFLFSRVFPIFDEVPEKEGAYGQKRMEKRLTSQSVPLKRKESEKDEPNDDINITFYPEGGNLVQYLTSYIVFKATDGQGRDIEATVEIANNGNRKTPLVWPTIHQGMGHFTYRPVEGASREALVTYNGKSKTFPLPEALPKGYVLGINNYYPKSVQIFVRRSPGTDPTAPLGLLVSCRGVISEFKTVDFGDKYDMVLYVPREELPNGVNQLTLLDQEGTIHAECMVFINNKDSYYTIQSTPNKTVYKPYERIQMHLSCTNRTNEPQADVSFSLAVRDAGTEMPTPGYGNVFTNLLLSSDLKGFIENPEYYFEQDDTQRWRALHLLLAVQGWRRYAIPQMMGKEPFTAANKVEKGIVTSGTAKTDPQRKGIPEVEVRMSLSALDSELTQNERSTTDSLGNFSFPAADFWKRWELQLDTWKDNKRKVSRIELNRTFAPIPRAFFYQDTYFPILKEDKKSNTLIVENVNETVADSLSFSGQNKEGKQLDNFTLTEKGHWNIGLVTKSSMMYDVVEEEEHLIDDGTAYNETLEDFLSHINPFFSYTTFNAETAPKKFITSISPGENNSPLFCTYKGRPVLFVVNDRPLDQSPYHNTMLSSSDFEKIYIIEEHSEFIKYYGEDLSLVWKNPHYVIIHLQSYKNASKKDEPLGTIKTQILGYSTSKEFYNPVYKKKRLPDKKDYRRTLYWNPNLKTDAQGRAEVSFYNNDLCEEMRISAEGVTDNGTPVFYAEPE